MHSRFGILLAAGLCLVGVATAGRTAPKPKQPNIVFILADDLGWSDVGYHRSEIRTPHIDRLAAAGAKLEQFYVMPVCTPTRAALLTGRYPMRYGLQSGVCRPWSDWGLPVTERTLAQELKEAGYRTAITGKWHLGSVHPAFLPTARGFDHQHGCYNGAIDYFTHDRDGGHDWHRNDRALHQEGYSTDLIGQEAVNVIEGHSGDRPFFLYVPFNAPHSPLQAPQEAIRPYADLKPPARRRYAAMVTRMDEAIGRIAEALERKGLSKDTLLVFSSDNGGPLNLGATNRPLRAGKFSFYEGGVRAVAFATWPGTLRAGTVVKEPLHMVDWFPTLLRLAGKSPQPEAGLDGRDMASTLLRGAKSPHAEILLNVEPHRGALRRGDWKLVVEGPLPGAYDSQRALAVPRKLELYNIAQDPTEKTNLATKEPRKVRELLTHLIGYAREALPPFGGKGDEQPSNWKAPRVYGEPDPVSPQTQCGSERGR